MFSAFFLDDGPGRIFCIAGRPEQNEVTARYLLIAPFGEEMNKSRHVLSAFVRQLEEAGHAVIFPDLTGTGDSEGDFGDATLDAWRNDLDRAVSWLGGNGELHVIALRSGALLAADAAMRHAFASVTLIHPVVDGKQWLNQLLRLRLAGGLLGSKEKESAAGLRQKLSDGQALEIAGYTISSELAHSIESLSLVAVGSDRLRRVHWIELVADGERPLMAVSQRVIDGWLADGVQVEAETLVGDTFWATQEIAHCPQLLARFAESLQA